MSKTRIKQATTEELIALKRELKDEINERVQRQQKVPLSTSVNCLLAAPRDIAHASTEDKRKAAKLLAHVQHADYDDIERMWKKNPRFMLTEVAVNDGKPNSPLKLALYNADTWTWRPFYEWIQQNQPDLVPEFLKQNDAQKEHVDLQPLNNEYALTDKKLQFRRNEISDAELDRQWKELLKKQNEILPFHMVREMCREGDGLWNPESKFDAKTAPKGGLVYDYEAGHYIKLDSNEFRSKFGSSFGLYRGYAMWPWGTAFWTSNSDDGCVGVIRRDAASIRQLFKIRIAELASIPTLDQASTFKIAPGV